MWSRWQYIYHGDQVVHIGGMLLKIRMVIMMTMMIIIIV